MHVDGDYYEVLGVARTATADELKRAYYGRAMKHHPDKVTDPTQRPAATARFQELGHVYRVLSDPRLRAIYDQTGGVEADELRTSGADDDGRDWTAYWRDLFPPLTAESVRAFEVQYKGSDEELRDLQAAYVAARGEMDGILDAVYFGSVEEEDRYRGLLAPLVAAGTLPSFPAFTHEPARKRAARHRRAGKERAEAEAHAAKLKLRTDADLTALIQGRRKTGLDDLVARLEAKYGSSGSANASTKRAPAEPTDAEFAAAAKRLHKKK